MEKDFRFLIYKSTEEDVSVDAVVRDETIWLSQKGMAELFGVQVPAISKHLKSIFEEGELKEEVVVSKMEITAPHGAMPGKIQTKETQFYNLDAIISVGYRVNSRRATHFRIWATSVLKEYMIKGFVLDDERLKQGKTAFAKTTSVNYWSGFVPSAQANAGFGSRSLTSSPSAVSTMTKMTQSPRNFMPWCKTCSTMRSPEKPLRRSFLTAPITKKNIWG